MTIELGCVTVDSADPRAVAGFWAEALGWGEVHHDAEHDIAICGPPEGGVFLEFVRVPEPKGSKNRLHLGCHVDSLDDLEGEVDRLQGLGATVAWEEEFPPGVAAVYRNIVLRDPEGNEFCLGAGTWPD
ncbi:MAG: VOC family protein [Actinomycetota bacterium]